MEQLQLPVGCDFLTAVVIKYTPFTAAGRTIMDSQQL